MHENFIALANYYIVYIVAFSEVMMILEFFLERKHTLPKTIGYVLGTGVLGSVMFILFKERWVSYDPLLYFLMIGILYKGKPVYKIFSTINAILFSMIAGKAAALFMGNVEIYVGVQVISAAIIFSVIVGIKFIFKDSEIARQYSETSRYELVALIIVNLITIWGYSMGNLMVNNPMYVRYNEWFYSVFVLIILIINIGILVIIDRGRYNRYYSQVNKIMEKQLLYYENIEQKNKEIRSIKHDMLNHLLCLGSLIKEGKQEQGIDYIQDIYNQITSHKMFVQTGNTIVDTIINEKAAVAQENNISLEANIVIPKALKMDMVDICVLLSNSLDNAIDACMKIQDANQRKIIIQANVKQGYFIFKVVNTMYENIEIKGNKLKTTKVNMKEHGYGIDNMKRVVMKYHGDLKIECRNYRFTLEAILAVE